MPAPVADDPADDADDRDDHEADADERVVALTGGGVGRSTVAGLVDADAVAEGVAEGVADAGAEGDAEDAAAPVAVKVKLPETGCPSEEVIRHCTS